jgi:3-oxoacyl-[acyl-carrier protein] reductase
MTALKIAIVTGAGFRASASAVASGWRPRLSRCGQRPARRPGRSRRGGNPRDGGRAEALLAATSRTPRTVSLRSSSLPPASLRRLHALVNNAGHVHQAGSKTLTPCRFRPDVRRACARRLPDDRAVHAGDAGPQRDGAIVNIASQLGQIGGVELVHYSAAKAAIIGLTKALAREVSAAACGSTRSRPGRSTAAGPRPVAGVARGEAGTCRSAASASRRRSPRPSPSCASDEQACLSARRSDPIPEM